MKFSRVKHAVIPMLAAISVIPLSSPSLAATATAKTPATTVTTEKNWQFEVVPYLFLAGLSGTTGVQGYDAQVNLSAGDLLSHLDVGAMGYFQAKQGRWIFGVDAIYVDLSADASEETYGPLGLNSATDQLEVEAKEQIYTLMAGYRVVDDAVKLDVFGAGRYTGLEPTLTLTSSTSGTTLPGDARSVSADVSWWDPVIGARVRAPLANRLAFVGSFDLGGFGTGSEFSYQAIAGVDWQFATAWSAKGGYRALYQDYREDLIWDMTMAGFYTGVGFRF